MSDEELRAFFARIDERFDTVRRDLGNDIASVRTELGAEIASVRTELGAEIASVRTELGAEIASVRTELGADIAAVRRDLGNDIATVRRELGAEIEDVRSQFVLVSEGFAHLNEKIEREVADVRDEMRRGFAETHSLIQFAYSTLEQRIERLEQQR
jgi:gas vesicle protein